MVNKEQTNTYTLDAQGKKLGRLASEVAVLLMGKNKAAFVRRASLGTTVRVIHASQIAVDSVKARSKKYVRYSGYPGGLKQELLGSVIRRRGYGEAIRRAVYGMLPSNKLRNGMMKHLFISE